MASGVSVKSTARPLHVSRRENSVMPAISLHAFMGNLLPVHQTEALRILTCKQGYVKFNTKPDRHIPIAFVYQLILGSYGAGSIIKGKALFDTHRQLGIILMQHSIAGKGEPDGRDVFIFFQVSERA